MLLDKEISIKILKEILAKEEGPRVILDETTPTTMKKTESVGTPASATFQIDTTRPEG